MREDVKVGVRSNRRSQNRWKQWVEIEFFKWFDGLKFNGDKYFCIWWDEWELNKKMRKIKHRVNKVKNENYFDQLWKNDMKYFIISFFIYLFKC
jgi:hypothetical protein